MMKHMKVTWVFVCTSSRSEKDSIMLKCFLHYFCCSETNDGGCVNDRQLRDFTNEFLQIPPQPTPQNGRCGANPEFEYDCVLEKSHYQSTEEPQNFTLTVINPAFAGTMRGVKVLQQLVPHHCSTVKV